MRFLERDLRKTKATKVSVIIVQMDLTGVRYLDSGQMIYDDVEKYLDEQIDSALSYAEKNNVDLIVFPELSIPSSRLYKIEEYLSKNNSIVVGGSHYIEKGDSFINQCPIFLNEDIYYTHKTNISYVEDSPIKFEKHVKDGDDINIFYNTEIGDFAILICADFLNPVTRSELLSKELDFVVVCALQPDSNIYYETFHPSVRSSEEGIYFIYCNCLISSISDGNSALFGIMDKYYHPLLMRHGTSDLNPLTKLAWLQSDNFLMRFEINIKHKNHKAVRNEKTRVNVNIHELISYKSTLNHKIEQEFSEAIKVNDTRYLEIEDLYVPPNEFDELMSILESKNILLITGDPGMGKTYSAIKLLYDFYKKGFKVQYLKGTNKELRNRQRSLLLRFLLVESNDTNLNENAIYYFEDPFGTLEYESVPELFGALSVLKDSILGSASYIIITTRTKIFDQFSRDIMNSVRFKDLISELNVRKPSYDEGKLSKVFHNLAVKVDPWYPDKDCVDIIEKAIQEKSLMTPFSMANLAYSSVHIKDCAELKDIVENRRNEFIIALAQEIRNTHLPTKAFLIITFLYESELIETLDMIYTDVIDGLNRYSKKQHLILFNQILREQSGYRVEFIFGKRLSRIRFSHSSYYEALFYVLKNDQEAMFLLDEIVKIGSSIDLKLTYKAANKILLRNDEISRRIYELISSKIALGFFDSDLYELFIRNCLYAYEKSGLEFYLNLVESFISRKSIAKLLVKSSENTLHNVLLRLRHYYWARNLGKKDLSNSLDWDQLRKNLFEMSSINVATDIVELLHKIDKEKTQSILLSDVGRVLLDKAVGLSMNRRTFLADLYKNTEFQDTVKNRISKLPEYSRKNISNINRLSDYNVNNFMILDDGAIRAISKGYNLLPVGVKLVEGSFLQFEKVGLRNNKSEFIGTAIVRYSSKEIRAMIGVHSSLIESMANDFHGSFISAENQIYLERDT